jgi:hypothetical protein
MLSATAEAFGPAPTELIASHSQKHFIPVAYGFIERDLYRHVWDKQSMPSKNLREMAEYHARESVRAAYLTNQPESREKWLKVAQEWMEEARLRGSTAPTLADLIPDFEHIT